MISLSRIIDSKWFERMVTGAIIANAVTLGLETSSSLSPTLRLALGTTDRFFLLFFVLELSARVWVHRWSFLKDPWGVFDLLIVSIALIPATGSLSALRALRVLRTLRLITAVPTLRRVVSGLLSAIPGMGAVGSILLVVFYVGAVIATNLFGAAFPDWFGSIDKSAYSLFQIMTLESWSMGIVRPLMNVFPAAWLFFIPFILVTTFTMLNLFIAVIVNAMHAETDEAADARARQGEEERAALLSELCKLREGLEALREEIATKETPPITREPYPQRARTPEVLEEWDK
ncbi:MAG: ion transporter [Bdellovibrionaceae bacterium]|nr:ion transporter [Bdellovibrionales bacterium]MCB9255047.1 ion transporter [Pseudobdellovibrionaceae bacterium]